MNKLNVFVALIFTGAAASAFAQEVDPAPSGNELSHISVGDRSTVETPGRDAPVSETREGNRTTIDFDRDKNTGNADSRDTTIERDPQ